MAPGYRRNRRSSSLRVTRIPHFCSVTTTAASLRIQVHATARLHHVPKDDNTPMWLNETA